MVKVDTEQWVRRPSSEALSEPSYDCSFRKNVMLCHSLGLAPCKQVKKDATTTVHILIVTT